MNNRVLQSYNAGVGQVADAVNCPDIVAIQAALGCAGSQGIALLVQTLER